MHLLANRIDAGQETVVVETLAATYFYHKEGGGFSHLIDRDGRDWIGCAPGDGAAGEYRTRARWPQPIPGAFNYYHESSRHLIDCILEDREPVGGVDWGLHITEMMAGAIESSKTGRRYMMTTSLNT